MALENVLRTKKSDVQLFNKTIALESFAPKTSYQSE